MLWPAEGIGVHMSAGPCPSAIQRTVQLVERVTVDVTVVVAGGIMTPPLPQRSVENGKVPAGVPGPPTAYSDS